MPRRRNAHLIEMVFDATALMPWWVGVVLALLSFLFFHFVAGMPSPKAVGLQDLGGLVWRTALITVAGVAQYFFPVLFLVATVASAIRRLKRQSIFDDVVLSEAVSSLDGMSWTEFEQLVGEAFRLDGFEVEQRGGSSADGGIDLVLRKGNEKFFVQCKQWRALKVGVDVVRQLYGVMAAKGATGGFIVTSGSFTEDAVEFASGRNLILVDGPILFEMIKRATPIGDGRAKHNYVAAASRSKEVVTSCPVCGSAMVMRTAKRGSNTGREFWGCSEYPTCKGTRSI